MVLLTLAGCPADWRKRDTALEVPTVALTLIDWHQTRGIVKRCDESNPIIGDCGQHANVNAYFLSALMVEFIVSRALSTQWRSEFQAAWIGIEGATTWDNAYGD